VRLVVVDAIQALAAPDRPLDEGIAAAVRALKMLAIRADVAILATSHLPGLARDRRDPRPTLDDFGALQSVKQTADLVLGLFREEMYGGAHNVEGATELLALKNRNGATGYVDLYFYSQWMRFEDLLEPD
jgi:replicative DNA helicase